MIRLFIGNKRYSSWSLRGWLAVRQSGLPFEETVVPMYTDAWEARHALPEFVASNGKVPVLSDDKTIVWDSLAIVEYCAERAGCERFWPRDPAARALARSIAAEMHSSYPALRSEFSMVLGKDFAPRRPSAAAAAEIERICTLWHTARARHGADGDYLFGSFGAADIMFAPVATRFDTYKVALPPLAQAYVETLLAHPFVRDWYAAAAREEWVIERYERAPA